MMLFLEILIIVVLFLGPSFFALLGWSTYEEVSVVKSVHPILYLLLVYSVLRIKNLIKEKFYLYNALGIILVLVIVKLFFDQFIYSRFVGNLMVPLLMSFFVQELTKRKRSFNICKKLFFFLFMVEIALAIIERLGQFLIFPYSWYNPEDLNGTLEGEFFRSNSLLGHPLSNALCVSVAMSFVVISELKNFQKYSIIIFSLLALLCFNARFAFILSCLLLVLYNLSDSISIKKLGVILIGFGIITFFVLNYNFGDRLFSQGVSSEDSSIAARIDIFDIISFMDMDILFFRKGDGIREIQSKLAIDHVENWLLIMIFDLGILLSSYYVLMILNIAKRNLISFSLRDKLYVFFIFIIIASSNNSLATQVPALSFFVTSSIFLRKSQIKM